MSDDDRAPATRGRTAGMPTGGVSLGRIFGVRIQIDWSLLIIFALVTFTLGSSVFPAWHPAWTVALTWALALGAAVLLFASVLAHELCHAVVAQMRGIPVPRITLFLFGGAAQMTGEPRSPKDEFVIAIAGPAMSLVIGVVAWFAGSLLAAPVLGDAIDDPAAAMSKVGPLATLLLWLGPVNVFLGLFNMVPGFPLDGGRVLRSVLWWAKGDIIAATRWASRAGQVFAWALMAFGVWGLLAGSFGGLWLILIGWFLNNAARMSFQQLVVRQALENVAVRDIMVRRFDRVEPDMSARELAEEHFMVSDQRAYPVESGGEFLGLVCFDDVRALPRSRWDAVRVADLMTPVAELSTLPPGAEAEQALERMARLDVDQIPVLENGELVGLVRRRDIVKWLALRESETESPGERFARAS